MLSRSHSAWGSRYGTCCNLCRTCVKTQEWQGSGALKRPKEPERGAVEISYQYETASHAYRTPLWVAKQREMEYLGPTSDLADGTEVFRLRELFGSDAGHNAL